ncbi:hypothetical protein J2S70_000635 [Trueperella bonasi]|uniref:Uncharacterized protein n=1 Tax=Trueperella bonasi TaxID=312286 RepID=A0ABT9NG95_9ACTO|nr:hypothetical protein [Trueperella bonasi]MDP9806053.1 hypothetical protein [Trueperella bonasi]
MFLDVENFGDLILVSNGEVCGPEGCTPASAYPNVDDSSDADLPNADSTPDKQNQTQANKTRN